MENNLKENIFKKDKHIINIESFDPKCEEHAQIKECYYIKYSVIRIILLVLVALCTGGLIFFMMTWWKYLQFIFLYSFCNEGEATQVMIKDKENVYFYVDLQKNDLGDIVFEFKLFRYIKVDDQRFKAIGYEIGSLTKRDFIKDYSMGLMPPVALRNQFLYGKCNLIFEISSIFKLLINELSDPFYLFQIGAVILWFNNDYQKYAVVILVTSLASLLYSVYELRVNLKNIQNMAKYSTNITIIRNNHVLNIQSEELTPGDIYFLPEEDEQIPADSCLITGSVICNEALLTGESTPVIKEQINKDDTKFSISSIGKSIVYAGTKVIQRRGKCMALVLNIGFNTEKGCLIRSILFPKTIKSKLEKESVRYILFMAVLGMIGYFVSAIWMFKKGELDLLTIALKFLDLITIVVPPALPACLAIGVSLASRKLKSNGINCIDRNKINAAGMINTVCFDKTGTLTDDSLEIIGFKQNMLSDKGFIFSSLNINTHKLSAEVFKDVKKNKNIFAEMSTDENADEYHTYQNINKTDNLDDKNVYDFNHKRKLMDRLFIECLASCHTLNKVRDNIIGDPIDVEMFEKSSWDLIEEENEVKEETEDSDQEQQNRISVKPKQEQTLLEKLSKDNMDEVMENNVIKTHYEISVKRRFNFSSKLQRMTVVCKNNNDSDLHCVFSKGSPEKIRELCEKETFPSNYDSILNGYASKGFRVLALSGKLMKMNNFKALSIDRNKLETKMIFLGLIIVQNKLKPATIPTLSVLSECRLKILMATGDNILTAIAVSKESGLIQGDTKIFACSISNNLMGKETLQWEAITDTEPNKDEEEILKALNKTLNDFNISRKTSVFDEENESKRKQTIASNEVSVLSSKIYTESMNRFKKSFLYLDNYDEIKQFYKYLDVVKEEHEENEETKQNITTTVLNVKQATDIEIDKNLDDDLSSNYSIEINLDELPFEKNASSHNFILATNGTTFERIYKLSNYYKKTKDIKYEIYYETLKILLRRGAIFARMSPDHKTILVEALQSEEFNVLMCGDGANDCGALKAANVGVSLSQEEASIAAPFTSKVADISCLIVLLCECKSSLVTSFQCFKFMMMYSLIQFISTIILNMLNSYLQDNQFLVSDLFIIFPIAVLLEKTEACEKLTKDLPNSSLISFSVLLCILLHTFVFGAFQVLSYIILSYQTFFIRNSCKFSPDSEHAPEPCTDNTVRYYIISYFIRLYSLLVIFNYSLG